MEGVRAILVANLKKEDACWIEFPVAKFIRDGRWRQISLPGHCHSRDLTARGLSTNDQDECFYW